MATNMQDKRIFEVPTEHTARHQKESIHHYRNEFQRDRDRVLYSRSFRRLNGKTQVFLPLSHDYVRNRMTHTLEVSQIARVSAQNLGLNADLVEAISLAHDIGHTPFGHVGERILNFITNCCDIGTKLNIQLEEAQKGFKHNLQGIRTLHTLEIHYPKTTGLNLTNHTLWGIKNHSGLKWKKCEYQHKKICYNDGLTGACSNETLSVSFYERYENLTKYKDIEAWSFEAFLVAMADEIAQRHHDLDDAYTMEILTREEIINKIKKCFSPLFEKDDRKNFENLDKKANKKYFLSYLARFLVHFYNKNLIKNTLKNFERLKKTKGITSNTIFSELYKELPLNSVSPIVNYSQELQQADDVFKKYLRNTILHSYYAQRMDGKGSFLLKRLFEAYYHNPRQLPDSAIVSAFSEIEKKDYRIQNLTKARIGTFRDRIGTSDMRKKAHYNQWMVRSIVDFMAGMTDRFVLDEYEKLYGERAEI